MASSCTPVLPPWMLEVDLSGPRLPVTGWTNPCGNGVTLWLCLCALGGDPLIPGRFSLVAVLSSSCPSLEAQIVVVSTVSHRPWDALSLVPHGAEGLGRAAMTHVLTLHMTWVQVPAPPVGQITSSLGLFNVLSLRIMWECLHNSVICSEAQGQYLVVLRVAAQRPTS